MDKIQTNKLNDEYKMAIGSIVFNFSALEFTLNLLLGVLETNNEVNLSFFTGLGFDELLKKLRTVSKEKCKSDEQYSSIKKVIEKARNVNTERNRIIHSCWMVNRETLELMTIMMRKNTRLSDFQLCSINDVKSTANEIESVYLEVITIINSVTKLTK